MCASSTRRWTRWRSRAATRSGRSCSSPSASKPRRRPTRWPSIRPQRSGVSNFSLLVSHVLVPPAMEAILASPVNRVQGFLAAGHVCTVMGYTEYEPIARQVSRPDRRHGVRAARYPQGVYMCVKQLEDGRAEVENQYARAVQRARQSARPGPHPRGLSRRPAQVARRRRDPAKRLRATGAVSRRSTRRRASASPAHGRGRAERVHQRTDSPGSQETARMPGIRRPLHARASARRDDGLVGRAPVRRTTAIAASGRSRSDPWRLRTRRRRSDVSRAPSRSRNTRASCSPMEAAAS